ncbi:MAG: MauE/DoxX family redox-associated membrane protein [Candidatus Aminicenantaceae bacterium]
MIHNKHLIFAFRLVVGGVFIWAGLLKITSPLDFAQNIKNYQIFPHGGSFFLALVLPWIEIICGVFLLLGVFPRASALLVSLLLVVFLCLVLITIARGIDIDCGCFGSLSRKVDFRLIAIDSLLFFLALNIFFSRAENFPFGVRLS